MTTQHELYWSHTPALLQTLLNVEGPILELGCGHYSSAITTSFSKQRRVVCVDTEQDWLDEIADKYASTEAIFKFCGPTLDEYKELSEPLVKANWGVVLVDHRFAEQRGLDLLRLKDNAEVILMHDSHLDDPDDAYNSFEAIQSFKYFKEHSLYWPQTAVMSETNNLEWLQ